MDVRRVGKTVEITRTVPFGDCDPAGIAYTGKITNYAVEALDEFWKFALDGPGWFEMNVDQGFGTPFVSFKMEFSGPITPREKLLLRVSVSRQGVTSISFQVDAFQAGAPKFSSEMICVFAHKQTLEKRTPPDWVQRGIDSYL
ncbi:acyl-CoA thioesterase [Actibacterium sp.]|uniref:acyl-CoA thioesterase n=1 Tax=Actibacterium sp. TaxID=1872125 RepID=UPI003563CDF9